MTSRDELAEKYVQANSDWGLEPKVNGSAYEGECACFCGTIANIRKASYKELGDLKPDSSSPTERWFLGIRKGDNPDNNPISQITAQWTEEFMKANEIKIPVRKVSWG